MSSWSSGEVEMSSLSNRISRNAVREQQDKSKCRPGAAGQAELASGSSRKGRECRLGAGKVEMSSRSSRVRRNVVPGQQDMSKCRPRAAGYVDMSSRSSRTCRNVFPEQQDTSKRRRKVARRLEMSAKACQRLPKIDEPPKARLKA